ncbi:hypothetical protein P0136_00390 [Lentisphaerota bacterium ZTH]|nr:hypothetical protein JYG24_08465 [Lentisphaerota bacterium]WET06472.1 hypothetical protein P0136_00390 [Lentisphaerota bacterium ZTH]
MNNENLKLVLKNLDWKKIILTLIGIACLWSGVCQLNQIRGVNVGMVFRIIISMVFFVWAAMCFVLAYLPGLTSGAVSSLLWNTEKLKAPPEILSPIQAAISSENYELALDIIEKTMQSNPDLPEVWLLKVTVYQDFLMHPGEAIDAIEQYFQREELQPCESNITMLLRYTELCEDDGQSETALILLKHEVKKSGYSNDQKKLLNNRIEYLTSIFRA